MVGGVGRALVLAAVFLPALLAPATARGQEEAELESQRARLERLQGEIQARRQQAERLGRREQSVLGELREVERDLGVTRQLLETLEIEIAAREREITRLTRELARAHDRLLVQRQILARRLRSIYKLGRFGTLEILLRSESFADALGRYEYLRLIAEQDARLLRTITRLETRIRADRVALAEARRALDARRAERLAQAERLESVERDRRRMLAQVQAERSEQIRAADALEAETRKIQELLAALERRRAEREAARRRAAVTGRAPAVTPPTSTLTADLGSLDWPVEGEIVGRFGRAVHPVYRTEVMNNGIDIAAPRGTPVRSVGAGEVAFVDWNGGYGLMVILDHEGGYYSIYAHLENAAVTVGQRVAEGAVIGAVGESGSLTGPRLHFEIREGGRAVDPIAWLRER
ncbi:MAG TPA: peptidoglycan DD-metalloendopeptidase family protein [Candidatus Polarisedimenticolia bacterium]|nr:peptidoglycan DD-metalloendopeptidase family protein [Candidatus Polarisedimenticolia bacterium]